MLSPKFYHYFSRVRGQIIPGTHRMQKLLGQDLVLLSEFKTILVTGSNGKGSTCAFLESILRAHGYKTGLYTSPHFVHPNERVRLNGEPVFEDLLLEKLNIFEEKAKYTLPDASFFEIFTAAAFKIFIESKIDFLVCEVGLGGRFDSTNVVAPLISVLTSVSLEHTEFLGADLYSIAKDKSFISRRNKSFIVASELQEEALKGVHDTVSQTGSCLFLATNFLGHELEDLFFELSTEKYSFCSYYKKNLRTSLAVLSVLQQEISFKLSKKDLVYGIGKTFWPGRFDVRVIGGRTVIFDCAHNPEGFQFFYGQFLQSKFSGLKCHLVFASFCDKDWKKNLDIIEPLVLSYGMATIGSARSVDPLIMLQYLELKGYANKSHKIFCDSSPKKAIEKVFSREDLSPILFIGSIAFIGEVFESMKLDVFNL